MVEDKDRGKVYNPSKDPEPEKRKHRWSQEPQVFEIGVCVQCGGNNITWSEYNDYCWCYDCKIDYIPFYFGVFEGPISVQLAELLGIQLERINLETRKVYKYGDPEFNTTWP